MMRCLSGMGRWYRESGWTKPKSRSVCFRASAMRFKSLWRISTSSDAASMYASCSSGNRLELSQHGWNELGDGWVNMHGALHHRIRRLGVHHVQNAVDRFIAASAQQRCAENLVRVRGHNDFHKALRLPFFNGAAYFGHRSLSDQSLSAALHNFGFRHPGPAERRIDVQSVSWNPVAHAPRIVVQEVCRHNFEVVIGGVREPALAIAIAQRPDARHVGA